MNRFDWQLLRKFWAIAKLYWQSSEKRGAWVLLVLLGVLSLSVSGLNVAISFVGRFFQNALVAKNQPEFWRYLFIYAGVFVVGTPIVVVYRFVNRKLGIYWRQWLTGHFLEKYFSNRAYYEINADDKVDNPDQRIAEDVRSFTVTSLSFLLIIIGNAIDLISFSGILWSISVPLTLVLIGYSILGTIGTLLLGKRLIKLNFDQLRYEGNFRYGLVHVRDNAESIAFYGGEEQEFQQIRNRFRDVFRNFNLLIGWQRNVDFFTTGYGYLTIIVPTVVVAPMFFRGEIDFGAITQASFAFRQILEALSIIVNQIEQITAFSAGVNRLAVFTDTLETNSLTQQDNTRKIDVVEEDRLSLDRLTLQTPGGKQVLIQDLSLVVEPGQGLLVVGPSGTGKSSLLRAIAGLWNTGTGRLGRPGLVEMMFLPQRPYMLLGTLREQLLYPGGLEVSDRQLEMVLAQVNLADLPERVGGWDMELDWDDLLSLGEQQRLAFARLLLQKPRYAILDEATSALDLTNEENLYRQLQHLGVTYLSVGHRASLRSYHDRVLELFGDTGWQIVAGEVCPT
jgi:putative ATP-binding cassette transporter